MVSLAAARCIFSLAPHLQNVAAASATAAAGMCIKELSAVRSLKHLEPSLRYVSSASCQLHPHSLSSNSANDRPEVDESEPTKAQWAELAVQADGCINPCNSPLHPAVVEGVLAAEGEEISVQEAYTPQNACFGCGPAHPDGLHLRSRRIPNGLEATVVLPPKYCAFPGIINGGILSTLLDCHGNWTAAIALMDKSCLSKPPLTLTASLLVNYREPTPPDTELYIKSQVVSIKDAAHPGVGKATVEVDLTLSLVGPEYGPRGERLLAHGTGIFKRHGALRAL